MTSSWKSALPRADCLRVCFYAAVESPNLLDVIEFYRRDLAALRELGHDVRAVTSPRALPGDDDLYWVWWPTSGAPAIAWARLRRRPAVLVTALSDRDRTASGTMGKTGVARLAMRVALATADLTLATSQDTRAGLAAYRVRRLRTAPLGVEVDTYSPGVARRDGPVLTISQLTTDNVERKRILDVVRTAAAAPASGLGLRFVIAGRLGGGEGAVRAEIRRLGVEDRVALLGQVSTERKRELLRTCVAYFQPTHYEAFGMAIAEAMACGAVVVSNAVGNVPELLGEAGVLTPPDASPEVMAHALAEVATGQRHAAGPRARERIVTHYSLAKRRDAIARAITDVTERPAPNG